MIDLEKEKALKINMSQTYKILSHAIDVANEDGFLNTYTFERALWMFAAIELYDIQEDKVLENPLVAWNEMLADGTIDKLCGEYEKELQHLAEVGEDWFIGYEGYLHSVRGAFGDIQNFMKDMTDGLAAKFGENGMEELANVLKIADEWGMNNAPQE